MSTVFKVSSLHKDTLTGMPWHRILGSERQKEEELLGAAPVLEEKVNDGVAAILVLEEHEQRPVHEPDALLQLPAGWARSCSRQ